MVFANYETITTVCFNFKWALVFLEIHFTSKIFF